MGGKAFKRRLLHSLEVATAAQNYFAALLKCFIANILKRKARLKQAYVLLCVP